MESIRRAPSSKRGKSEHDVVLGVLVDEVSGTTNFFFLDSQGRLLVLNPI
jgi:hypothetical protein